LVDEYRLHESFFGVSDYIFRYIEINKLDPILYHYGPKERKKIEDMRRNFEFEFPSGLNSITLPRGDNIKVKEYINGEDLPFTYYIDIGNANKLHDSGFKVYLKKKEYILNPRKYYNYRFETCYYEIPGSPFGNVSNAQGFCIEIEDDIDFWFKDCPSSITASGSSSLEARSQLTDKLIQHNIKRITPIGKTK